MEETMSRNLARAGALTSTVFTLAGCGGDLPTDATGRNGAHGASAAVSPALALAVRELANTKGFTSLTSPAPVRPTLVKLGRMLAFDRIRSGNRDISCMTCHLPALGTGDGRSLSIGQGASGLGAQRVHPQGAFIPRNAPSLFNLHALNSLFWDGRVSTDGQGTFHTPAGAQVTSGMTSVFEFGPVSALPLFPVLSREEMRAVTGNELAAIPDDQRPAIWQALMTRLGAIGEYRELFEEAYPGTRFDDMSFAHASNAIAGFLLSELTFNGTPWDQFLIGNDNAMSLAQLEGAQTFLSIRCSQCHNGAGFTDNQFHNVAVAQFGPGQGDGYLGNDDFGRMRVTGLSADQYRFRTTPLRNVTFTGPYGHDGAMSSLREFIEHYSESHIKLRTFDPLTLEPLLQGTLVPNAEDILLTRDQILDGVVLPTEIVDQLMAFMDALADPRTKNLAQKITPPRVPSGLPVDGSPLVK
jgi:cytochrome c peroxidase